MHIVVYCLFLLLTSDYHTYVLAIYDLNHSYWFAYLFGAPGAKPSAANGKWYTGTSYSILLDISYICSCCCLHRFCFLQQTRFQAMSESIVTKNILFFCRLLVFSIFVEIYAIRKINNLPRRLLGLVKYDHDLSYSLTPEYYLC